MKKLIAWLYKKYCQPKTAGINLDDLSKEQQEEIYRYCDRYVKDGILEKLYLIQAHQFMVDGFFSLDTRPFMITRAGLYKERCDALEEFITHIGNLALQDVNNDIKEYFDPNSPI